ncbi:hypothetical protein [Streptomyces anandii]|uniref:hypothetical protein n=1 Tax=Streptomyces anandii TaxID=285454 RepID=UPI001E4E00BB|nr:hypothetical protein [Streptomyces anandii]
MEGQGQREEGAEAAAGRDGPPCSAAPEAIRDYVRERVAAYKYPRTVSLTAELPKGPTGKILKREITVPPPPVRS